MTVGRGHPFTERPVEQLLATLLFIFIGVGSLLLLHLDCGWDFGIE